MSVPPTVPRKLDGRFRIRQVAMEDLPDLARVKARAWRESYDLPDSILRHQDEAATSIAGEWADEAARGAYFWGVLDTRAQDSSEGELPWVGLALAVPARDADAPAPLELAMIYLLEVAKGSGIADRLLQMAIGDAPCYLWVLENNPRAMAFCARHGFAPDGARQAPTGSAAHLHEVRLVRN